MTRLIRSVALVLLSAVPSIAAVPDGYKGRPFEDEFHKTGPAKIPGIVQAALYDLGGEGVAYHDTTPANEGSGGLNASAEHQRSHASAYLWGFRRGEAVDISYVKDIADLNHPNPVSPHVNQLYIGWAAEDEWTSYTVEVAKPGRYRVKALYSFQTNAVSFDVNGKKAGECKAARGHGELAPLELRRDRHGRLPGRRRAAAHLPLRPRQQLRFLRLRADRGPVAAAAVTVGSSSPPGSVHRAP